jgi:hypothetical protein
MIRWLSLSADRRQCILLGSWASLSNTGPFDRYFSFPHLLGWFCLRVFCPFWKSPRYVCNDSVAPVALICIVLGIVSSVIGWSAALKAENFKLIKAGRTPHAFAPGQDFIDRHLLISAVSYGFTL